MPSRCLVLGCRGNYSGGPKVSCYSFPSPSNYELRGKWLEVLPLKHPIISRSSKVCELHFVESDFVKTVSVTDMKTGKKVEYALDQVRLKKDAVPSVFPDPANRNTRNGSLHGHGKRKEIRDVDEDLNATISKALTTDVLKNNASLALNNWEKDETSALIALYELEPCLYDKKDRNYYNKGERNNAYCRIQQVMMFIRPTCTVDQIKKKISTLRSIYVTEKLFKDRSIRNGYSSEATYEPSLWCFKLLQFLDDHIVQTGRRDYKKLLTQNEVNYNCFEDEQSQSLNDAFETNSSKGKQRLSEEVDENKGKKQERLVKIAEAISNNNKQNATEDIGSDNDEEHETLITNSETVGENYEDKLNEEPDNGHSESSEDDDQNYQDNETPCVEDENSYISDRKHDNFSKNSTREKRKLDNSVSTSKKVKTEKICDKEDIFGRYVSGEMKTLKHNPLVYLKTKQSILKILTEANFKLINSKS